MRVKAGRSSSHTRVSDRLMLTPLLWLACASPDPVATRRSLPSGDTDVSDSAGDSDPGPSDTGTPTDTAPADTAPQSDDLEACWLGPDRDHTVCLPVVPYDDAWGDDYAYPDALDGSAQYAPPARFVDLEAADAALDIAPDFVMEEYMAAYKGRWGVMQGHVVDRMQEIRDEVGGAVSVNSGYRSPGYNVGVGGVEYSRHQFGDAVDIDVDFLSADELADVCDDLGASYVSTYDTGHTHCDWRDVTLDPAFYDVAPGPPAPRPTHQGRLALANGLWTAVVDGFDEGEPDRLWTAWSSDGRVIGAGRGVSFEAPTGAARVQVQVGHRLVLSWPED